MSYRYEEEKAWVFTDAGQRAFLLVRDFAAKALALSGAVTGGKLMEATNGGDTWKSMACADRLVELGELHEVTLGTITCVWQDRVFVKR